MENGSTAQTDTCCLACSLPLVKLAARVRRGRPGEVFEAASESPGFLDDVKLWCLRTGHSLLNHIIDGPAVTVTVRRK